MPKQDNTNTRKERHTKTLTRNGENLTHQQKEFCLNFVSDPKRNAKQAYLEAYPNTTERSGEVCSNKLLRVAKIQRYINHLEQRLKVRTAEELDLSHARWLRCIALAAFADPRKLVDENGKTLPPQKLPDDIAMAIEQMDVITRTDGEHVWNDYKYKLAPKRQSQELLGRAMRWLEAQNVNLNVSAPKFTFNIGHTQEEKLEQAAHQLIDDIEDVA